MLGIVIGLVVALFVVLPIVSVILVALAAVLFGSAAMIGRVFSGSGVMIGVILGYLAVCAFRKNRAAEAAEE